MGGEVDTGMKLLQSYAKIACTIDGIHEGFCKMPVPNRQYHHPTVLAVGFNGYSTVVENAFSATLIDNLQSLMEGVDPQATRDAVWEHRDELVATIVYISVAAVLVGPSARHDITDDITETAKILKSQHEMVTYNELMRMSLLENGWVGCYKDDGGRDLKSGPQTYGYTVATCRQEAEKEKKRYFALQNHGWCVTDNAYSTDPTYYGKVQDNTECGTECDHETAEERVVTCGSAWVNAIYKTIPDNAIYSGDTVYLKSKRLRYMFCDGHKCHAQADCPFDVNNRASQCSGEQATIYNPTNSGPIMNGQVVWLQWANSHFLRCLEKCETGATCPYNVESRKDESNDGPCYGERFVLYNSLNSGPILADQTVWLKMKRKNWLRCEQDRCDAEATCPESAQDRAVTQDTGCSGERFVLEK